VSIVHVKRSTAKPLSGGCVVAGAVGFEVDPPGMPAPPVGFDEQLPGGNEPIDHRVGLKSNWCLLGHSGDSRVVQDSVEMTFKFGARRLPCITPPLGEQAGKPLGLNRQTVELAYGQTPYVQPGVEHALKSNCR